MSVRVQTRVFYHRVAEAWIDVPRCRELMLEIIVYNLIYSEMQERKLSDSCFFQASRTHSGKKRGFVESRYWLRDLVLSLLVALIIAAFFYEPVQVKGTSMLPLLKNHERIVVNKIAYHVESIHRGDIIVFHFPLDPAESFIKRVIGLPGDWIRIKDGKVYVNGKKLSEPYVRPAYLGEETCAPVHVPPNHYYVLGDHRDFSSDSRDWGTVAQKYIYGKAVFAYWPLSDLGSLH